MALVTLTNDHWITWPFGHSSMSPGPLINAQQTI
jgi:hypothetical protein